MRCGVLRAALGEALHGSAPTAPIAWLLLEHPGPWPYEETESALPAEAVELMTAARKLAIRPQLIRRARSRRTSPHQVYLAYSGGPRPWLRAGEVDDLRDLAVLDLAALARGEHPYFGVESTERIVLVCTHGRHDPCCALTGRPAAEAIAAEHPESVWETTHLGGHRFAATFVTLPEATYHGATTPATAPGVAAATLRGEVVPAHYRGRAGLAAAAQSAEYFARREFGVLDFAGIAHQGTVALDADTVRVSLTVSGRPLTVTVRRTLSGCARAVSCGAGALERAEHHALVAIDLVAAA